jgi:hypothetical protein
MSGTTICGPFLLEEYAFFGMVSACQLLNMSCILKKKEFVQG